MLSQNWLRRVFSTEQMDTHVDVEFNYLTFGRPPVLEVWNQFLWICVEYRANKYNSHRDFRPVFSLNVFDMLMPSPSLVSHLIK